MVYDCLKTANFDGEILSLKPEKRFPSNFFDGRSSSPAKHAVIVRKCALDLLELFCWVEVGKAKQEIGSNLPHTGLFIRGTPGDGKSRTSQFFLYHFVKNNRTVVFECAESDIVWVFRSDGRCRHFVGEANVDNCKELRDLSTIHIFDAKAEKGYREPPTHSACLVVFTSAGTDSMKQTTRRIPVLEVVFPTPTKEEALRAAKAFGTDVGVVESMFDQFGGHFRFLFDAAEPRAQELIDSIIAKMSLATIDAIFKEVSNGGIVGEAIGPSALFATHVDTDLLDAYVKEFVASSTTSSTSASTATTTPANNAVHSVVVGPQPGENVDAYYAREDKRLWALRDLYSPRNIRWRFASKSIARMVLDALVKEDVHETAKFVRLLKASASARAVASDSFRSYCTYMLSSGGTFPARQLVSNSKKTNSEEDTTYTLPPASTLATVSKAITAMDEAWKMNFASQESCFLNMCGRIRGVDAVRGADAFQYTIIDEHIVHLATTASFNAAALTAMHKPATMYFVVPECRFKDWKNKQAFLINHLTVSVWKKAWNTEVLWSGEFHSGRIAEGTVKSTDKNISCKMLENGNVVITIQNHSQTVKWNNQAVPPIEVVVGEETYLVRLSSQSSTTKVLRHGWKNDKVKHMEQWVLSVPVDHYVALEMLVYPTFGKQGPWISSSRQFSTLARFPSAPSSSTTSSSSSSFIAHWPKRKFQFEVCRSMWRVCLRFL